MKKIIFGLLVFSFVFAGFASLSLAADVNICHKQGQQWVFKVVAENTLNGHLAHGDFLYRGRPDVYDWEMDDWCNINAPL